MDEDKFLQAFRGKQRIKDEAMAHNVHQLAFGSSSAGSILSAASITAATNVYATGVSSQPYYKKEVDDAALFMDNKLKISAFNLYTICTDDSMHKLDDMSHMSSYAITEYFNVMYDNNLLTPGSECKYAINDTKNVVKHIKFLTQSFENIAQHKDSSPIERITYKWENLYMALI